MTAALAGCAGNKLPASVSGGECKVFERPEYAVKGAKRYDQNWIDGNVEAGVGGCGWARPAARPASIDAADVIPPPAPPPQVSRARRIMNAFRHPIKTYKARRAAKRSAGTVAPRPAPVPANLSPPSPLAAPLKPSTPATFDPPTTPIAPPPQKKREPIDELLQPKG